jgi:hypothetical protein
VTLWLINPSVKTVDTQNGNPFMNPDDASAAFGRNAKAN